MQKKKQDTRISKFYKYIQSQQWSVDGWKKRRGHRISSSERYVLKRYQRLRTGLGESQLCLVYSTQLKQWNIKWGTNIGHRWTNQLSWLSSDCNAIVRNCISSDTNQVNSFPLTQHGTTSAQKTDILFTAVSMARLLQFNHKLQISISWWNRNQILLQTTQIQSRETIHILWSTKPHWEKESVVSTLESWSVKPEGNASIYGNLESR